MSLCLISTKIYRVFICYIYDNFIEIFSEQHIGCIYAKYEALHRTIWWHRFGGGFGPVVRQNTE